MWLWAAFVVFILFLLALDLGVFHRKAHVITLKEALALSGMWISVALAFNAFIYFSYEYHWFGLDLPESEPDGQTAAVLFLTGYVIEKSLGLDNILVIAIIFEYFRIPALYQHRVLFWGVVGALVMRAPMIPAIFAITSDPFLVFTSNIMAVLGLRSLYFASAGIIDHLYHLRVALALLLVLIGTKFLLKDLLPTEAETAYYTLAAVSFILSAAVIASLSYARRAPDSHQVNIPPRPKLVTRRPR